MISGSIFSPSDKELLYRYHAGDRAAFEQILERYENRVMTFLCSIVNRAVAEELTQHTFLRLLQKARERAFRKGEASIEGLLIKIARNLAFNYLRDEKTKCDYEESHTVPDVAPASDRPDAMFEAKEMTALFEKRLAEFDEGTRMAVLLVWVEGLSMREAARRLNVSLRTVQKRLARAREIFARLLGPYWEGETHGFRKSA